MPRMKSKWKTELYGDKREAEHYRNIARGMFYLTVNRNGAGRFQWIVSFNDYLFASGMSDNLLNAKQTATAAATEKIADIKKALEEEGM